MEVVKAEILSFFKDLRFNEEEHKYFVNGKQLNYSVSGIIKKFHEPFKRDQISKDKAKEFALIEELGCSFKGMPTNQKEVLSQWDTKQEAACKKGTNIHLFGEVYPFNRTLKPKNKFEEAVVKFWNDLPNFIVPVIMELQMYHKEYMFAGTGDILLYNKNTGEYIIGDYKTNEDLFSVFNGKIMKNGFSDLHLNNFNKYQLQLSFYQILFEQLGLKVSSRKLIWLRPTGEYEMYDTEDYTDRLKNFLKNNKL